MNQLTIRRIYLTRIFFLILLLITLFILYYYTVYYDSPQPLLYRYRFVRSISVIISGIVIGLSATYLQGCLRNPLVDHYIIGIGSGALFATYLALVFIEPGVLYITSLSAVIGGLTTLVLTITISEYLGGSDIAYVLVGIGINALFSGLSILLSYIVVNRVPIPPLLMLTGSFINSSLKNIPYLTIALALSLVSYPILAKPLNTMLLGDTYAKQLGYNPRIYRLISVIIAGVSSSIIVSIFGLIGFIGLISPHISRLLFRTSDHRFVSPASALVSAILLLATDSLSRIVFVKYISEIPAGAIVSIIGAPFFISLLISRFRAGRID